MDGSEITSFNIAKNFSTLALKSPDENHFANTPQNRSPANVYRSEDCNEILAKELAKLDEDTGGDQSPDDRFNLVSQSSIEIHIDEEKPTTSSQPTEQSTEYTGEVFIYTCYL